MADKVQAREFGVQFREAIDYLKGKLPEVSLKSDDLAGPVHAKVFTVAGATSVDLVRDMHSAVTDAVAQGRTLSQFRKDFDRIVQEHGWTYKGKRGWRSGVIFNTNMRSAHMAGRWQQLVANKARRPYLQYRTAGDSRVRPQHRMWDGLIYPFDDAFWQTHYPPNGWGCRCTIRAYGEADLKDGNLAVSKPFDMQTREVITRDGEIKDKVPLGIDPGWDHNVGQSWISPEVALGQKLARLPRQLQGVMVDKTISPAFQEVIGERFKSFRTGVKTTGQPRGEAQIVGYLDSATLNALGEKLPALELESTSVAVLDRKTAHLTGAHKAQTSKQAWPADWVDALPENFRNYQAVLWDKQAESLIVVPQGSFNDTLPRIAIKLNANTKFGKVASVVSLGSATKANLSDTNHYELLVGKLK
jgi:SPP1 gp7 family putative phage head morphogenesis protein